MKKYLYVCSIGPIQDFIAAARRTRDLWYGSFILSEISKAVAREIAKLGGQLIFPALEKKNPNLEPGKDLTTFNVANIILAEVSTENIQDIASKSEEAAQVAWKKYADEVYNKAKDIIDKEIWIAQVPDVIEFYAAWTPLTDDYKRCRTRVMQLLGSRKNTRNFKPSRILKSTPKSSLDGARESVLKIKDNSSIDMEMLLKMRLKLGEELCAVGMIKRLGRFGDTKSDDMKYPWKNIPFPSVTRVALDPWIRGIIASDDDRTAILQDISICCKDGLFFASGTGNRLFQDFPFDGQILFPSRAVIIQNKLKEMLKKYPDDPTINDEIARLETIKKDINKLFQNKDKQEKTSDPDPYYAILIADGDRIGKVISQIDSADNHRIFSKTLSEFASKAREIIEADSHENHGCLVYSGGDDVLAFLPVDTCLKAARQLHDTFSELLQQYKDEDGKSPTLSVGIAIGHARDPLEDILLYARAAEHHAKGTERDGLALHLHIRSGGEPIQLRECWKNKGEMGLDERLECWAGMYINDTLPDKAAYDLRQLARDYQGWSEINQKDLEKDIKRLLGRKRSGKGTTTILKEDIEKIVIGITDHVSLSHRAEELVCARKIATNIDQATPNLKKNTVEGVS